ncbi:MULTISPECIES: STAS-like domain-containing protein [unclassified Cobetia]|uniref:STAS-like domain-containing protein n=1 Tax=unclassified Cobetia TaxID=2609414 RepID=UPI00178CEAA8|nr:MULTISPECIES: STAS-like domain-containing protein [unclassified Cobetia]MBE2167356.1 STAS-like domain-containing protein [Cobetia sp. 2AS1]MDH2447200.1 STAS-like domain-containing protein [Cobetia sp. 2AS]
MKTIKVMDRYPCPGPRYASLGPSSGEEFKKWLKKELENNEGLTVDLDGTEGYGSSFLEEAFGGLIRDGIDASKVLAIKYVSKEEPEIIDEINEYIEDAIGLQGDSNG